jgi:hypothetical protein
MCPLMPPCVHRGEYRGNGQDQVGLLPVESGMGHAQHTYRGARCRETPSAEGIAVYSLHEAGQGGDLHIINSLSN